MLGKKIVFSNVKVNTFGIAKVSFNLVETLYSDKIVKPPTIYLQPVLCNEWLGSDGRRYCDLIIAIEDSEVALMSLRANNPILKFAEIATLDDGNMKRIYRFVVEYK